jgi:type VI secretion system secreted protein VgrG
MDMESGLKFSLQIEGLNKDAFELKAFSGREGLSELYEYTLELVSLSDAMRAEQIVDKPVCITILSDGNSQQFIHGIVQAFSVGDTGHHYTKYTLTLVPALRRLTLRHNSRIFQLKTGQEIIETLFKEMGIDDYAFSLGTPLAQREHCVQYRESDFDFISRLAAEEGMFYFTEHSENKHTLVFSDNTHTLKKAPSRLLYNPIGKGVAETTHIRDFAMHKVLSSSSVELKDYSFKNPEYSFAHQHQATELGHQHAQYEHYDYPGRYKSDDSGKPFSQYKMEELAKEAIVAHATSDIYGLCTGLKFDLDGHLDPSHNRDWLIVSMTQSGQQNLQHGPQNQEGQTLYSNTLKVIPGHRPWRASTNSKPRVDGPQIAKVVGPQGEEIFCDEHGRVKVHFPWDRDSKQDEFSSCWVRVSQGWAGAGYGMIAVPRIGHEVIISFLEGDPDQPIITGRTYHAANQSAYILPNHKTRTIIKTQTHKGEGFNELRLEDEAGQEQIYLHGQKDLDIVINQTRREWVGLDQHHKVGRHLLQMVTENTHSLVGKNITQECGQDQHIKIGRNLTQKVLGAINSFVGGGVVSKIDGAASHLIAASQETQIGANQRTQVNNESYLQASDIILEASQALTIKGPGGFIKIDSGGITIQGNVVKINEGGSPGKGTAPKPAEPQAPDQPVAPDAPDRRG